MPAVTRQGAKAITTEVAQFAAVFGVRERFTRPMAIALRDARTALRRLANYNTTADDIRLRAARVSLSPAVDFALVEAEAKGEATTAEACLREAARLEGAYQAALLAMIAGRSEVAA